MSNGPIDTHDAVLSGKGHPSRPRGTVRRERAVSVIWVDSFQESGARDLKGRRREAEHPVDLVRPVQLILNQVQVPVSHVGDRLCMGEALFAGLQGLH